ncbi:putative mitochondrial protein, partial [Mucuna pruriens]
HFQTKDLGHLKYFLGIEVTQSKEGIVISQRKYALDILQETSMSNYRPVDSPMDPNMKLMYLFSHFQTKDLGHLKYFLGIEVAQSKEGIVISQRKYALDILQETSMSNCKPVDSPMDPNMKLMVKQGEPYSDPERYRRLVGKLIYLTITRPDISFAVGVVSQFVQAPCVDHWAAVLYILKYIKKTPRQGLLYKDKGDTHVSCYCDVDWARSLIDRRSTIGLNVYPIKGRLEIASTQQARTKCAFLEPLNNAFFMESMQEFSGNDFQLGSGSKPLSKMVSEFILDSLKGHSPYYSRTKPDIAGYEDATALCICVCLVVYFKGSAIPIALATSL